MEKEFEENFNIKNIYVLYNKELDFPIPFKYRNKIFLDNCLDIPMDSYGNQLIKEQREISRKLEEGKLTDVSKCYYESGNSDKIRAFIFKNRKREDINFPSVEVKRFCYEVKTQLQNITDDGNSKEYNSY